MPTTTAKPRPPNAAFAQHCCELLASLGPIQAKRMFLGWGLSVEGLTVAVIAYDTLYLKANAATLHHFTEAGSSIFEHTSKGVTRRMQYYTAPEAALESPAAMQPWAALALQAALAARKPANVGKPATPVKAGKAAKATKPKSRVR